ncbi:MAG: hypothetical protein ABI400_06565 [Lacisediminihabitans sp.]
MHRGLVLTIALGCFCLLGLVAASRAQAASPAEAADAAGITIDYPQPGATVVPEVITASPLIEVVTLSGTLSSSLEDSNPIVAYIDGRLNSCEDYFGQDPFDAAAGGCYYTGVSKASHWTYQIVRDQVERLGFDFYGKHTVEIRWMHWSEEAVISHSDTVTFTLVKEATSAPSSAPSSAAAVAPNATDPNAPLHKRTVSQLSSGSPSAPSVLGATLSVQHTELSAVHVALTALATVILLLIVGYPGLLLGNTLGDKDNYERLFGRATRWLVRVKNRARARRGARARLPRWVRVAAGMLIATVIAGFIDPGFGFNPGSARLLASVAIAFVLQNLLGWWLIRRMLRRSDPELKSNVEFKAGSLVILAIAVVVSRIVGFEPGMVFGLMVGLSFGATLAKAKQARVTMIGLGYAFGLALIGWVGYSLLTTAQASGFWPVFLSETLSGLAVSGIASLPIALLPLAVFDGAALLAWKKWVWAVLYGIGLFAFLLILMPLPFSWGAVSTPLTTWIALYLAYALVAVGVWVWFRVGRSRVAKARKPVASA